MKSLWLEGENLDVSPDKKAAKLTIYRTCYDVLPCVKIIRDLAFSSTH